MMNYIFPVLVAVSFVSALITGKMSELSAAVTQGAQSAVELLLRLTGMLCFWGGMTEIMERSGITQRISSFFRPALSLIFPKLKNETSLMQVMSFNITANILGLGNAATPAGLETMRRLDAVNPYDKIASDEMVIFVVMNTAALRIIPTTVAMLRGQHGSENPMEILLPSIFTSVCALAVGLAVAKIGNLLYRRRKRNEL